MIIGVNGVQYAKLNMHASIFCAFKHKLQSQKISENNLYLYVYPRMPHLQPQNDRYIELK